MKSTAPPENWATEVDRAAGEPGASKSTCRRRTRRHRSDLAAGELGTAEIAAVEDYAGKVEVQALPGHCSVFSKVGSDHPYDRVSDFADGLEG